MTTLKNLSYANAATPLKRLFAEKLEPQRRPVEDIYVAANRGSNHTEQENRNWLRNTTADLVRLGLVKRIRPGGENTSVTHIQLTTRGEQVLRDALVREQQEAVRPKLAPNDSRPAPATPTQQVEPTFESIMRDIERFRELYDCQFEWNITRKGGVDKLK